MKEKRKSLAALILIFTLCFSLLFLIFHEKAISKSLPVYEKVVQKLDIHYLIVGDSIGRGAGVENRSHTWFSQWEQAMKQKYPIDLIRHSIVQSGATAYEGLYLIGNAKPLSTVDLVFLIFGENDRKYMNEKQFSFYYEGLIYEIKTTYPKAELVLITESCLEQELFAEAIKNLAEHYHAVHIDMRIPFKKNSPLLKDLSDDNIHPNELGYKLYAEAITKELETGIKSNKQIVVLREPLLYKKRLSIKEQDHFKEKNELFHFNNGYYQTSEKGARISYSFDGTNLGVKVLKHVQGGEMDVFIDGQFIRRISTWWPINKERVLYVTSGLQPGKHEVTFVATGTQSAKNQTTTQNIQLSSIVVFE
ncbi:SGNH/GDSL hydrolase family protein [Bacillus tuaregi]|uniref:SGNH/GDSL hydrolase family protein n=1 Tax=Bacillus tuaregi TaxID=1816695 RepID=UPI0008F84FB8|nr:SGNH/GDSL hydrolase family protein [Bacillus tuaregi]